MEPPAEPDERYEVELSRVKTTMDDNNARLRTRELLRQIIRHPGRDGLDERAKAGGGLCFTLLASRCEDGRIKPH